MVVITPLNADILPGDFLVVDRNLASKSSFNCGICPVMGFTPPQPLEILRWTWPVALPPLCSVRYENLHHCKADELIPGTSSVVDCNDILRITFVFSAEILEDCWVDFFGMKHVFFTRVDNHLPFSMMVVRVIPKGFGLAFWSFKIRLGSYYLANVSSSFVRELPLLLFLWSVGSICYDDSGIRE